MFPFTSSAHLPAKTFWTSNESNNSLPAFSNLVYLETRWESTDGPFDPPKPCITLPRLEVLIISFRVLVHRYCPVEAFFEQLILPSIKKIVVDGDIYGAVRAISSMFSRSLPCDLLTLSINGEISARPGSLTSLLHLTPQLEHLEIPLLPFDDLSNLLTASESPVVVPNLQSLHIYVLQCTTDFYSSSLIATGEMLSNAGVDFRLKSLKLIFRTTDACHSTYRILQQSLPVGELDDKVLAHIKLCKRRFLKEILDLQSKLPTPPSQSRTPVNIKRWSRLNQLFNTIEGYDFPMTGYLHVSDVFSRRKSLRANLLGGRFEGLGVAFSDVCYCLPQ